MIKKTNYFEKIYSNSWKKKQQQKYEEIIPKIKKYLKANYSLLDVGSGREWFEDYLELQKIKLKKLILIEPIKKNWKNKKNRTYFKTLMELKEKIDFVIAIDSIHLLNLKELNYLKEIKKKYLLVALPKNKFNKWKNNLIKGKIIEQGIIGREEKDYFQLIESK